MAKNEMVVKGRPYLTVPFTAQNGTVKVAVKDVRLQAFQP